MSNLRILTNEEHQELDKWLVAKKIVLNHRTRRDLSDVVNMALLFKNIVGKMVNMKHYTSHGQLALKVLNWETFSLNVLRKTNLILMRPALELLASGDMNAIRSLLFHLMRTERDGIQCISRRASPVKGRQQSTIDAASQCQETAAQLSQTKSHSQISTQTMADAPLPLSLPHENSNDAHMLRTPTQSQMDLQAVADNAQLVHKLKVTCANYEEQMRINEKKEMYIVSLSQKIQYLEKILLEKEKRINQLLDHLSKLSVRIISMQTSIADEPLPAKATI